MHRNAELIRTFYTCFANRDAQGMAACYHPSVTFSDEVFVDLDAARAKAMWQMLCERGKDLKVEFRDVDADDSAGRAHWEAWYTFSATGRPVHNKIDARFVQSLGYDLKAIGFTDLRKNSQPFLSQSLERVRRSPWFVCPAAEKSRAASAYGLGDSKGLVAALNRARARNDC